MPYTTIVTETHRNATGHAAAGNGLMVLAKDRVVHNDASSSRCWLKSIKQYWLSPYVGDDAPWYGAFRSTQFNQKECQLFFSFRCCYSFLGPYFYLC
ncbi:hypothetical protein GQ55_8G174100 [Panicum hallii var. hallii]|uniref:Uncharacterized protein n=1 Tax=Panicum hallii var. hallii TaxID=1504633 RepID=A0A2T7CNL2_9POAL|nr:hypothetical protein GQ55_8G174100 [Panicum hallii var. hallii]